MKVRAARVKYAWRKGKYIEELADEQSCDFETAAGKAHTCTFDTKVGGKNLVMVHGTPWPPYNDYLHAGSALLKKVFGL